VPAPPDLHPTEKDHTMTHSPAPETHHRLIPNSLSSLATANLTRMARHPEFFTLPLPTMLTAAWRKVGYLPADLGSNPTDRNPFDEGPDEGFDPHTRAVGSFVILRQRDGDDDYIAFRAEGIDSRGTYDHVPASQRTTALLADATHAWTTGVHGTLAEVLGWARSTEDFLHGIEATLTLPDSRVCALPDHLYDTALTALRSAVKSNVRSRMEDVASFTDSMVLVPEYTGIDPRTVTRAVHAHLLDWCDGIEMSEFLPGTDRDFEAQAVSEAIAFVEATYPDWVVPIADGGEVL
jgi:hypothetical protein